MGTKNVYERFLWFEGQVRAKRFPNAFRLSEEFEMSVKTAQRDIEFMRDRLNCPLIYDGRRKGYCYEQNAPFLPHYTTLTSQELSSLMIARKMLGAMSGAFLSTEVNSAIGKITAILESHTSSAGDLDSLLSFHLIEYSPVSEEIFRAVLEACVRRKSMSFEYRSPAREEATERTADPYHIFNYMGTWHMVGYCHLRKGLRDFRLNRIGNPRMTGAAFKVSGGFSPEEYFASSFGLYKGRERRTVRLRFRAETARWVGDQIWHRDQKRRQLPDGSLELSFPVAGYSEISREILKHGSGVEVLEPPELRDLIRAEAERILNIY